SGDHRVESRNWSLMLAPSRSASRWFRKIIAATWRVARFWGECPVRRFTPGRVEKVRKVRCAASSIFPVTPTSVCVGTFWLVKWATGGSGEHSERKAVSGWSAALFLVGPDLGGGASVGLFHGVLPVGMNPERRSGGVSGNTRTLVLKQHHRFLDVPGKPRGRWV